MLKKTDLVGFVCGVKSELSASSRIKVRLQRFLEPNVAI